MKRFVTAALAMTLASGAFAGNSDRYNDLRFDSAKGHVNTGIATQTTPKPTLLAPSGKKKPRYADASPYGVGPYNDSR
jgi:hypothetical protein